MPLWARAFAGLALGIAAGLLLVIVFYQPHSSVRLEMDRETPRFTSGLYDGERDGELTFAWTSGRAVVRLAGLSRRTAWTCEAVVRSARPADRPAPTVVLAVDAASTSLTLTEAGFTRVVLDVPARQDRDGLTLSLTTAPVFVPGPQDTRELGVQVDAIACAPAAPFVRPPATMLLAAVVPAAAFSIVAALTGLSLWTVIALSLVSALGTAALLVSGTGPFGRYPVTLAWTFAIAAAVPFATVMLADGVRTIVGTRRPKPDSLISWPMLLAGLILAFELAALSHPDKPLIDAVFQAHRLEWVMQGRYFFTQPLPDGVAFPYAIGLYVVALPFAQLVDDYVLLVRATALFAQALAGLALYAWVWRERKSSAGASAALVLSHAAPLFFVVVGNANLPNVFAQATGTVAFVGAAVLWQAGHRQVLAVLLGLVAALACLSHVTTLAILAAMLVALAAVMVVAGGSDGRRAAITLALTTAAALVVSWVVYYQHFPDVYARALSRVGATTAAADTAKPEVEQPAVLVRQLSWIEKATAAARQTVADVGWPLAILAVAGAWFLVSRRPLDPFAWTVVAWIVSWGLLLLVATLTRVDTAYQRYAAEFIGRINLAGYPAAAVLGGIAVAAVAEKRGGIALRALVWVGLASAVLGGVLAWLAWFR